MLAVQHVWHLCRTRAGPCIPSDSQFPLSPLDSPALMGQLPDLKGNCDPTAPQFDVVPAMCVPAELPRATGLKGNGAERLLS